MITITAKEVLIEAILFELARQGHSLDPDDYDEGVDDWQEVEVPGMGAGRYDVNLYDQGGVFTVTAYPMRDGRFDYQSWIHCMEKENAPTDESRAFGPHGGAPWGN
jgi:hypothetical protein